MIWRPIWRSEWPFNALSKRPKRPAMDADGNGRPNGIEDGFASHQGQAPYIAAAYSLISASDALSAARMSALKMNTSCRVISGAWAAAEA